ncbi:PIR protein CIR protein [Plasmodium vinckei brucechwatti]|uniref:PIR protein CIR protein n=1 Tax=Plasmodium vinckei brucechwatti TaxID=119398 RepID=A0A6V7RRZ0_PLAVN|nr:PIR protein CIR protein [Plasmodium vinckei brucechwatti]
MDAKELCEKFIEADKIINDEYYDTMTMGYKTKYPNYNKHCSMSKCETDMKLNSLSEDLFDQLGNEIKEEYYEYFMMWLSDKLFKIVKEDDMTLNEAYEKYLNKNIQDFNYWILLDNKEGLKEVNLMYMKQFYKLLNDICNAIVYYKLNKDDIEKFIINSRDCSNQYSSLYNSVPKCDSYLHLLDNLKKTYEDFKNSVHDKIKTEYRDLANDLQTLTIGNTSSYFVEKLKEFNFSDEKCKPQKVKEPGSSKKMEQPPGPQSTSQKSGTSPQSGTKDSGTQKGNSDSEGGGKGGTNNLSGNASGGLGIGTGDTSGGQSDQGGSSGGSHSQGDSSNQGGSNDGPKALGDQVPTPLSGDSNIYLPNNWEMSFNLTRYMPSVSSIYESSKDILTNTTKQVNNAYNSAMTIAQDTYNKTVTAVKDTYNGAVATVKDAYTRSTNYISGAVNSITSQLSSLGSFPQLNDDQSGSDGSGNSLPTNNSPLSTTQLPNSDKNSPSLPSSSTPPVTIPSPSPLTPPSTRQSTPQSTQQISQTSSSSQPQDTQQIPSPSQPQTNHTQDKLQSTVQSGASSTLHQPDPNTGTGVQTMTITHVILPNSITDTPSIGNGSTTETVVKTNEKSSIWYIAQNKKYDILGIGIISISIFAFLAIMYKYLSLGCTSKSKRKKNMKKVINSIGGKRPIQIIIKSYDRNKDLKPVINSVDRKKDPLLNIYKLMQADPIPFINLFFLLIFFVYKRQLNYLEL